LHFELEISEVIQQSDTVVFDMLDSTLLPMENASLESDDRLLYVEDSVFCSPADSVVYGGRSLFNGTALRVDEREPIERGNMRVDGVMLGVVILLAVLMTVYLRARRMKLLGLLTGIFSRRRMDVLVRDSGVSTDVMLLPLALLNFVVLGLIGYLVVMTFGEMPQMQWQWMNNRIVQGLAMVAMSLLYGLFRMGVFKFFALLFKEKEAMSAYMTCDYLVRGVSLVVLLPLILLATYRESAIWLVVIAIFIAMMFLIRVIRCMWVILSASGGKKLYLFYYLCIFEIVPILVAIKVFMFL
jgi:hypothetical protein